MPCYSTIRTKMNNADNLGAALAALGYTIAHKGDLAVIAEKGGDRIEFSRYGKTGAFSVRRGVSDLPAIGRKYAEVGVRAWASRNRFTVTENDGVNMTLVNRRAF